MEADPFPERHAAREAEAGTLLGRRGRPNKAGTLAMDHGRIDTHVKPLLG